MLATENTRQDLQVALVGAGAETDIVGASLSAGGCKLDQQLRVDHHAARCSSQQTLRNLVAGKGTTTCNGRIYIGKQAGGTSAHLSCRNLSLGANSTVNAKPELEIYTDDVQCSHGATIGELDPDHLFYLRSRGVSAAQARALLTQAFVNECFTGSFADENRSAFSSALDG